MTTLRVRAELGILAVAAALAFAGFAYDPRAEAAEPKRVLGLLIAALALAAWLTRRSPRRAIGWGARAGIAFVGVSSLSLAWGLPCGARDLATFVAALGAGAIAARLGPLLGAQLARTTALLTGTLVATAAVGSALVGTRGLALHAGQGNPNWLGLLLAVTLPLSVDAAHAWRRSRTACAAALTATALELGALTVSHSRVGWGATLAALVFAGIVVAFRRKRWPRRAAGVAALAVFCVAGSAAAEGDVPADLALRGRAWIWHQTARAAASAAPFGAGLGRFGHVYLEAQGRELARLSPGQAARRFVNATTAHEEYLQAAVESGPVAALLLAWALLLGARAHARGRWLGGAAALIAVAVASLGDSPLRQPAVAIVTGLVLGVTVRGRRARAGPRRVAPLLLGLAAVTWLLFAATRGWLATRERSRANDASPMVRVSMLAKSTRLDPGSGECALELGLARLALGDADGALGELRRADELLADTGVRVAIGSALLAQGHPVEADGAYRRALAFDPGSFRARVGLAEALVDEGELDLAEIEALTARRSLPGDPRVRDVLDRIRERQMDQ